MKDAVQVLVSGRRKWWLVLIGSALFVVAAWTVSDGWTRWAGGVFFALCGLVAAIQLLSGGSYLRLDPEGFTVGGRFHSFTLRWIDIERFKVGRSGLKGFGPMRIVAFDFAADFKEHATTRKAVRWLAGYEGAIPDTYGMSCEELAALLNRYRKRASYDVPPFA